MIRFSIIIFAKYEEKIRESTMKFLIIFAIALIAKTATAALLSTAVQTTSLDVSSCGSSGSSKITYCFVLFSYYIIIKSNCIIILESDQASAYADCVLARIVQKYGDEIRRFINGFTSSTEDMEKVCFDAINTIKKLSDESGCDIITGLDAFIYQIGGY